MKFYDKVDIIVQSGKGGDGLVSARKEAGVPMGGPNGGNGGRGGSIILQADANINTLLHFKFQKTWKAKDGDRGERTDKYGKGAEDLILKVPVGAIIKQYVDRSDDFEDDDIYEDNQKSISGQQQDGDIKTLFQFTEHGQSYTICSGGSGGVGNMHFKNSTVQYPDFALLGEPGQKKAIQIELQILADVGLLGFPSVGKSSIINSICQTKAKVAEYHFTTLVPNLGSVKTSGMDFNIIDIPGIIKGASSGKGLGNEFLRHVLKCKVFCFVLDIGRYDEGIKEFGILWHELLEYVKSKFIGSEEFGVHIDNVFFKVSSDKDRIKFGIYRYEDKKEILIMEKSIFWLINKSDLIDDDPDILKEYISQLLKYVKEVFNNKSDYISYNKISDDVFLKNVLTYSTIIQENKDQLVYFLVDLLKNTSLQSFYIFDKIQLDQENSRYIELVGGLNDPEIRDLLVKYGYNDHLNQNEYRVGQIGEKEDDQVEQYEEGRLELEEITGTTKKSRDKKVRYVYDPEFSRLSYQMMRGKVLAEQRFWKVMKKNHTINWLTKNGIKTGDLIIVESNYDIIQKKILPFEV